jgi:hypothetical protein
MSKDSIFYVYSRGSAGWCACRADGLVCGFFVSEACALRFARREPRQGNAIILRSGTSEAVLPPLEA